MIYGNFWPYIIEVKLNILNLNFFLENIYAAITEIKIVITTETRQI